MSNTTKVKEGLKNSLEKQILELEKTEKMNASGVMLVAVKQRIIKLKSNISALKKSLGIEEENA